MIYSDPKTYLKIYFFRYNWKKCCTEKMHSMNLKIGKWIQLGTYLLQLLKKKLRLSSRINGLFISKDVVFLRAINSTDHQTNYYEMKEKKILKKIISDINGKIFNCRTSSTFLWFTIPFSYIKVNNNTIYSTIILIRYKWRWWWWIL